MSLRFSDYSMLSKHLPACGNGGIKVYIVIFLKRTISLECVLTAPGIVTLLWLIDFMEKEKLIQTLTHIFIHKLCLKKSSLYEAIVYLPMTTLQCSMIIVM